MESIWAIQMISSLVRVNNYKKQGIVDESIVEIIETKYGKILEQGLAE